MPTHEYQGTRQLTVMTLRHRGRYRFHMPAGVQAYVLLESMDGGPDLTLPASVYMYRGYTPALDALPWKDHFARTCRGR
jgi:hypothetical protein